MPYPCTFCLIIAALCNNLRGSLYRATPRRAMITVEPKGIIPLLGRLARLKESIGAVDVKLTAADLEEVVGVLSEITNKGDRSPRSISESR